MKTARIFALLATAGLCVLAAASAAAGAPDTTCSDGTLAAGTYGHVTVIGQCMLTNEGAVVVENGLAIERDATLNAITEGTLTVSGGITVERNGALGLGCSPEIGCGSTTDDHVDGGIVARHPLAMILHNNTVNGGISITGGGGGLNCRSRARLGGAPAYTTVEDSQITGDVTISGLKSCWLGAFRNTVHGTIAIFNNTFADPDANEVADNTVFGDLTCFGNSPEAQFGDSEGGPNHVSGKKAFECADL
jgi:hypothetical protein